VAWAGLSTDLPPVGRPADRDGGLARPGTPPAGSR
jgi:hypothetical protein